MTSLTLLIKRYHYGIGIIAGVVFVAWVLSGLFIVNPAEQAVEFTFR